MGATKSIFASLGVWTAAASFLGALISVLLKLDPSTSSDLASTLTQGVSGVFALVAIYGRIRATTQLTLGGTPITPTPASSPPAGT